VTERQKPGSESYETLPAEDITIDQVVARNMRRWRVAVYMTQEELGERLGWSAANVSAAERSAGEHRDRRRFDAQTAAEIADALYIPLVALYLPPEDDGYGKRYQWRTGTGAERGMAALMRLAMHTNDYATEAMIEYHERFRTAARLYLEPKWDEIVGEMFAPMDDEEARAEQAARFRARQAALLDMAAEQEALAEFLERPKDERP
jgi:transcriptional regulator with XRE-family HTH domain